MLSPLLIILLVFSTSDASNLVKTDKGHFIPGRGCGTNTEYKYLASMPLDLTGHECSFVGEEYVKFWTSKKGLPLGQDSKSEHLFIYLH